MGNKGSTEDPNLKRLADKYRIVQQNTDRDLVYLEEKGTDRQFLMKESTFNNK
mgnify:FL=1